MLAAYERHGGNVIAVEEVKPEETHQDGIVREDVAPSLIGSCIAARFAGVGFDAEIREHRGTLVQPASFK